MPFASERLIYRAPIESDAEEYAKLWDDPYFRRVYSFEYPKPYGKKWAQETLDELQKNALFYAIITLRENGEFLGEIRVELEGKKNRDGMLGIGIVEQHRGKGYGTETMKYVLGLMFTSFGLHRVSLSVFEGNVGAIALYKKLGFVEEGRKRKSNWVEGGWEDFISMGILEEEWLASQS